MKLVDTQTPLKIVSVQISKLEEIYFLFKEEFFSGLLAQLPQIGKETPSYYVFHNNLTLHNPGNYPDIEIFNVFLQMSTQNFNLIQITKN